MAERRGIPINCRCGERVSLKTSRISANLGRPFYACRFGDEHNRHHLFKWADASMIEELEDMKLKLAELEKESSTLEKALQVCELEIESLTMGTRTCEIVVCTLEKEMPRFEKELEACKMEFRVLKNMVLCFGLVVNVFWIAGLM